MIASHDGIEIASKDGKDGRQGPRPPSRKAAN